MNQFPSVFERANHWMKTSVTLKILSIGFLVLLLMLPAALIKDLIREREYRQSGVVNEVSSKWGEAQTFCGPILTVPYYAYETTNDNKRRTLTQYAHFLPHQLDISGAVNPKVRKRGIYEVAVYNTALSIKGDFSQPDFTFANVAKEDILWEDAFISVGVSDMRGIKENIQLAWSDTTLLFEPGLPTDHVVKSGVSIAVPLQATQNENYTFDFSLDINGSKYLNFVPLGKETTVDLNSTWQHPSFDGSFLPNKHNIEDKERDGFTANWKVLHLNRNFPQAWVGKAHDVYSSAFGVSLFMPVDQYQKTMRSAKYAIMFIALTFLVFFFVEVLNKTRIHPLQYLLVGITLCIFYLLLLSLSEHISFNQAYFVAASAVIVLITAYSKSIFAKKLLVGGMGILLVGLYAFLYSLLQLQDYALLMGSVGIFLILAIIMYFSRNIDWYNLGKE